MPEWYVYVLKGVSSGYRYVGVTRDLARRLNEHNCGGVQSTRHYAPFEIEAYVAVKTREKALALEKYFKGGSGKAVLRKRILTDEVTR